MTKRILGVCVLFLAVAAVHADERPKLVTKVYPVADLVVAARDVKTCDKGTCDKTTTCEGQLIKLLTGSIEPKSWCCVGGCGTVDYHPQTMSFVINQTLDVQEKVEGLLASLRKLQDVEVAVEVRLVTVSDGCFERIGVDFNGKPDAPCFLNDGQLFRFMEAIQGDQRTNVMQAPKVTVMNGQSASIMAVDSHCYVTGVEIKGEGDQAKVCPKNESIETGFRMTVQPAVTPDGRKVQVYLKLNQTDLAQHAVPLFPVTTKPDCKGNTCTQFIQQPSFKTWQLEKVVAIPDGGTVILGGGKKVIETRHEYGPPVLSKVPYVNRLFKNVGYGKETQNVYVLVTPRVVNAKECAVEECEAKCPTCPPCASRTGKVVGELVKAYDQACADGDKDEADRIARAALILDPTCFRKK